MRLDERDGSIFILAGEEVGIIITQDGLWSFTTVSQTRLSFPMIKLSNRSGSLHKDVKTTMIYTHVLNKGGRGVLSPLDACA